MSQRRLPPGQMVQLNLRVRSETREYARLAAKQANMSINAWADLNLQSLAEIEGVWLRPEPIDGQLTVDEAQETERSTPAGQSPATGDGGHPSASRRPRAAHKAERSTGSTPESSETVNATGSFPSGDEDGRRDREALVPVVDRSAAQEAPAPGGAPEPVEAGTPAGCPECGGEMAGRTDDGRTVCDDCGWAAE